jgi:hypothetical protein
VTSLGAARPPLPRYGQRSLAEVLPSLLAALGLEGYPNALGIEPMERACLLLVDGLGWEQLQEHAETAPFLSGLAVGGEPITAGFPATTVTSLATLSTGLPTGEHGMTGYTMVVPGIPDIGGRPRALECISWTAYGQLAIDLRGQIPPESVQPRRTLLEKAAADGLAVLVVGRSLYAGSGLTRAVLRGGDYRVVDDVEDQLAAIGQALSDGSTTHLVSAYYPELDAAGHRHGQGSDRWREQLKHIDSLVERIARQLPAGSALLVTADHGMVNLAPEDRVDLADEPDLRSGVRLLAGEARARHVHVEPGATEEVLAAWQERLGHAAWIASRDEAIEEGWFGPVVSDAVRSRIGDVVAAAAGRIGVFDRETDAYQPTLVGHHGSMTSAEQLVPLVESRAS